MVISQINKINKNVSSKRFDDFIYLDYLRNVLLLFLKREKENLREITESRRSAIMAGWDCACRGLDRSAI